MNINSEILVQTDYQINSVLEQFGITKMVFSVNLSNVYVWTFFQTYLISVISGLWYDLHIKTYRIFRKILQLILSFGQPTFASTKNYMFGRIVKVLFNFYMRFLIKKKILAFWRCNAQVFKIKSSVMFQQMVKSNFGLFYPYKNRLLNYTPFLKVIFYTILCHNFNGLVFSGYTNTAFLFQNLVISVSCVVGLTLLGIFVRSYDFYKMFVPSNVPTLLIPFLFIIEIISHIAKIFSLAIRLFANMMSGHILLHILTGFLIKLGKLNLMFIVFPLALIMCIVLLEYGIAFLQAYVFIVLSAIYFDEHFGFAQAEKMLVLKMYSIVGQLRKAVRDAFPLWDLMDHPFEDKIDFMAYLNIRGKLTIFKQTYFYKLTDITVVPLTQYKIATTI